MKRIITILALIACYSTAFAQNDIITDAREAIKTGSSREIVKLFDSNVDMTLDGKMKNYSKAQAEFILKDFFKKNPPTSFTIVHQGSSKSGVPYAIGEFVSNTTTYRVWIRVRKNNESFVIYQISFDEEN